MICTTCATVADNGGEVDQHCSEVGCACQHQPLGTGQERPGWDVLVAVSTSLTRTREDDEMEKIA